MNKVHLRAALFLTLAGIPMAAIANDLTWKPTQSGLQPGEPAVRQKIQLSPTPITPPGPEVPASVRGLSGRWKGWMCANRACFAAVDVTSLTATGGRFNHVLEEGDLFEQT